MITQLKPVSNFKKDFYINNRSISRFDKFSSIFIENDIDDYKFYYFDKILNKRIIKRDRKYITKYLIK